MLYVSTRNNTDSFTAYRTLCEDRAPDGGAFAPMRLPVFSKDQILSLIDHSIGENIAFILNQFFAAGLTGWDVDFCIGRKPFRQCEMNHRLVIFELWHNHQESYDYVVESLYEKICAEHYTGRKATQWAKIAIRIAVLFGVWAELSTQKMWSGDISVTPENFISAWYARKMGLPIYLIICASEEESLLWDLVYRGECATASVRVEDVSERDSTFYSCVEQLIFETLGLDTNRQFLDCCSKRILFQIEEGSQEAFSKGIFVSVASGDRGDSIAKNLFRSFGYISGYDTAVCFGAVQDYRAKTGLSRKTLLTVEYCPELHS